MSKVVVRQPLHYPDINPGEHLNEQDGGATAAAAHLQGPGPPPDARHGQQPPAAAQSPASLRKPKTTLRLCAPHRTSRPPHALQHRSASVRAIPRWMYQAALTTTHQCHESVPAPPPHAAERRASPLVLWQSKPLHHIESETPADDAATIVLPPKARPKRKPGAAPWSSAPAAS